MMERLHLYCSSSILLLCVLVNGGRLSYSVTQFTFIALMYSRVFYFLTVHVSQNSP